VQATKHAQVNSSSASLSGKRVVHYLGWAQFFLSFVFIYKNVWEALFYLPGKSQVAWPP
jgi:hypothetical protein